MEAVVNSTSNRLTYHTKILLMVNKQIFSGNSTNLLLLICHLWMKTYISINIVQTKPQNFLEHFYVFFSSSIFISLFHIDVANLGTYSPLIHSIKPIISVKYFFLLFISFARILFLFNDDFNKTKGYIISH